jgi:Zn-dependent metalloprotease
MDPHTSSGLPNKAFYLICKEVGGYSWEKIGKLWNIALKDGLYHDSKFQDLANITFALAGQLYGQDKDIQKAVRNGWEEVDVHRKSLSIENFVKTTT